MEVYRNRKALLARFTDSQMADDSKGKPTSTIADFYRTKTYVKPAQMINPEYPPFPEPYALAHSVLGNGNWNDFNAVFVIQVAVCNLNCWFCYVDKELRRAETHRADGTEIGGWFDAEEVLSWWDTTGTRILRVSGGEPMMVPDFIFDLWDKVSERNSFNDIDTPFLWVDTNMTRCSDFVTRYYQRSRHNERKLLGICGCFKGFTPSIAAYNSGRENILSYQFLNARRLLKETELELFFYVPNSVLPETSPQDIRVFFDRMRAEIHPNAPLRTHILQIKNYSPTQKAEWENHTGLVHGQRPISIWQELCLETYSPELLWVPDYQVNLR